MGATAFAVCLPELARSLTAAEELTFQNPLSTGCASFLGAIHRLDQLVYGGRGLGFPRWGLYDCAMVPGLVCGYARPAADCSPELCERLGVNGDRSALVPLSFYIAIPTLDEGVWLGHSIAGLSEVAPDERDMRVETVELALSCLKPRSIIGTTQWNSDRLEVLANWEPLAIRAAWIEPHEQEGTLVYQFDPARRWSAAGDTEYVAIDDRAALLALQGRVEAGERLGILAPPTARNGRPSVPIAVLEAE